MRIAVRGSVAALSEKMGRWAKTEESNVVVLNGFAVGDRSELLLPFGGTLGGWVAGVILFLYCPAWGRAVFRTMVWKGMTHDAAN